MKRWFALACAVVLTAHSPALACSLRMTTLHEEFANAPLVLYGTLANPREGKDGRGNPVEGCTTDFKLEQVIKAHPALGNAKMIELNRYVPAAAKGVKYLIFFDVLKDGKLDAYRGLQATPAIVNYLRGAAAIKPRNRTDLLLYAFRHLEHADKTIADDAYQEFANDNLRPGFSEFDYRALAGRLPADTIASWLQDSKTPAYRIDLYAALLGHCGRSQDAALLRRLLDGRRKAVEYTGIYGLLIGYTLLQPKDGWTLTTRILRDPNESFPQRYYALRVARHFHLARPNVVPRKDVVEAVCLLLDQADIADLAIEDLRRWKCWDTCDQVLALWAVESHDLPIVKRTILRYALCCPKPVAAALVREIRQMDPEMVANQEELLNLVGQSRAGSMAAEAVGAVLTLWP